MGTSWELAVGGEKALLCNFPLSKGLIYTPTLSHRKHKNSEFLMLYLMERFTLYHCFNYLLVIVSNVYFAVYSSW